MSRQICKFHVKGLCKYGSSCRFSHSDHSNNQYQDEYRPRKNANREYYNGNSNDGKRYEHYDPEYYHHEPSDYQPDIVTYHSRKDNNIRSHYNNSYNSENYNSNKNHYDDKYHSNYYSNDGYKYSTQKENNVKNNYKEYDNAGDGNVNSNYNLDKRNFKDNNVNYGEQTRPYKNSNDRSNYNGNLQDREKKLKEYEKEIKSFQAKINELLCSNIWPLTCYQPLGGEVSTQPVGSLNLIDVSFEEIRCDFYALKNIVADPESVHKSSVKEIMSKAQQRKEAIISLVDNTQADLLATFDKIIPSKMQNPSFHNSIQADPNNYWNMSQKYLKNVEIKKGETNKFSFALGEETEKKAPSLKILMQVETYGQGDNEAFAQENFTNFIPIMPPPKKFCL